MNILRDRNKNFQKKRRRKIAHQKLGMPFTRMKNLLWTLGIVAVLLVAGYFAAPYVRTWFTEVSDAIE